jgi:hypothetical protein
MVYDKKYDGRHKSRHLASFHLVAMDSVGYIPFAAHQAGALGYIGYIYLEAAT